MKDSQFSTSFSWFSVIGDIVIFLVSSCGAVLGLYKDQLGAGIFFGVVSIGSLVFFVYCTTRVAFLARIDGCLVFSCLFTSRRGRIDQVLALREIPFMKYPRYLVEFSVENGERQSIVLIPARIYRRKIALQSALDEIKK